MTVQTWFVVGVVKKEELSAKDIPELCLGAPGRLVDPETDTEATYEATGVTYSLRFLICNCHILSTRLPCESTHAEADQMMGGATLKWSTGNHRQSFGLVNRRGWKIRLDRIYADLLPYERRAACFKPDYTRS